MLSARYFLVSGKVQGVSFRALTARYARAHNLSGWVRNLSDGRVEVLAEGRYDDLVTFEKFLKHASPYADVKKILFTDIKDLNNFSEFVISDDGDEEWLKK